MWVKCDVTCPMNGFGKPHLKPWPTVLSMRCVKAGKPMNRWKNAWPSPTGKPSPKRGANCSPRLRRERKEGQTQHPPTRVGGEADDDEGGPHSDQPPFVPSLSNKNPLTAHPPREDEQGDRRNRTGDGGG